MWDKGMDINPQDEKYYTTRHQGTVQKYVENEYCAKQQPVPVNTDESFPSSYVIHSAMASGSGLSSVHSYDLSSDDEEYLMPNNVAEMTTGRSDSAAHLLTAARFYLNLPP